MSAKRYQWMGITALILTLLLLSDSFMVHATESGTIIGDGSTETIETYEVDEDEIWAQIDRSELRSSIDENALLKQIDKDALLETIDKGEILETISDVNLLENADAESILSDYNEKKKSGELDELIKDVIESEEFDEEFIKNHPVDVPNVSIPIVSGSSPLNYILDPQQLVYQTDAAKYGGGKVKEGATVLFKNTDGEYLFSDYSDKLKIVNKSNIPLQVTLSATIEGAGEVRMADSMSELYGEEHLLYMALVDEEGVIGILNDNGSSEINMVLKPVPDGTYDYFLNEETGKYEYELSGKVNEDEFDSFSFGLVADCNEEANWADIDNLPRVVLSWKTEPILTDWDKVNEQLEEMDKVKFEAYKRVCLVELREKELERLVQLKLDALVEEKLGELIDAEVDKLAKEKFEEIRLEIIRGNTEILNTVTEDSQVVIVESSGSSESSGVQVTESSGEGSASGRDSSAQSTQDNAGNVNASETGTNGGNSESSGSTSGSSNVRGGTVQRTDEVEVISSSGNASEDSVVVFSGGEETTAGTSADETASDESGAQNAEESAPVSTESEGIVIIPSE